MKKIYDSESRWIACRPARLISLLRLIWCSHFGRNPMLRLQAKELARSYFKNPRNERN